MGTNVPSTLEHCSVEILFAGIGGLCRYEAFRATSQTDDLDTMASLPQIALGVGAALVEMIVLGTADTFDRTNSLLRAPKRLMDTNQSPVLECWVRAGISSAVGFGLWYLTYYYFTEFFRPVRFQYEPGLNSVFLIVFGVGPAVAGIALFALTYSIITDGRGERDEDTDETIGRTDSTLISGLKGTAAGAGATVTGGFSIYGLYIMLVEHPFLLGPTLSYTPDPTVAAFIGMLLFNMVPGLVSIALFVYAYRRIFGEDYQFDESLEDDPEASIRPQTGGSSTTAPSDIDSDEEQSVFEFDSAESEETETAETEQAEARES